MSSCWSGMSKRAKWAHTSALFTTRCAENRCSSCARTKSRRPGRWSNPFLAGRRPYMPIKPAPGGRPKPTRSHRRAAGSIRASDLPSEHASLHVWPELFPDIAERARAETRRAAPRRLFPCRHTRRKPRVFDHVVDRVAGQPRPRELEMSVGMVRQKNRLQCVAEPRLEASPARLNVIGAFAPDRAEAGFERIRNRDVSFALQIPFARATPPLLPPPPPPPPPPLNDRLPPCVKGPPDRTDDGETFGSDGAFDDPVDAF